MNLIIWTGDAKWDQRYNTESGSVLDDPDSLKVNIVFFYCQMGSGIHFFYLQKEISDFNLAFFTDSTHKNPLPK